MAETGVVGRLGGFLGGLILLGVPALAAAQGKTERGTIADSIEYTRYVEEWVGGPERWDEGRRQPFAGTLYHGTRWRDVRQGQAVYRWRERPLYLIHDFFCTSPAVGATMPYTCEATAFVVKAGPPLPEHGGRLEDDLIAQVEGDFGDVEPHPMLPVFASIRYGWNEKGWSDEEAMVSVHDFSGRMLCPKATLVVLDASGQGIWNKLKVEKGLLACPGGSRVKIPPWPPALAREKP